MVVLDVVKVVLMIGMVPEPEVSTYTFFPVGLKTSHSRPYSISLFVFYSRGGDGGGEKHDGAWHRL